MCALDDRHNKQRPGSDHAAARLRMVEQQLVARGIRDPEVLTAMRMVPRHAFVPPSHTGHAYDDGPLPIAEGQTISQPYVVAASAEAAGLLKAHRILEIGTGSGYSAAVLSRLCKHVYTIERHAALAEQAQTALRALGYDNIEVQQGDGSLGWPEQAPFDAIIVTASGPAVPEALLDQLAPGGRLIMPVGDEESQQLLRITCRPDGSFERQPLMKVRFVRLVGKQGWPEAQESQ